MESVVAYKHDDTWYVASNYSQSDQDDYKYGVNIGLYVNSGIIMGFQGYDAITGLIRTMSLSMFNKYGFSRKTIVTKFIPKVRKIINEHGLDYYRDGYEVQRVEFILVKDDKAFVVLGEFDVIEIEKLVSIGEKYLGVLPYLDDINENNDIKKELANAYSRLSRDFVNVSNYIDCVDSKTLKITKENVEVK